MQFDRGTDKEHDYMYVIVGQIVTTTHMLHNASFG